MQLQDQLIITALDKALIGLILALFGYFLNKRLELFKTGRNLMNAMLQQRQKFQDDLSLARRDRKLMFLEKQLSACYWPLYLRLQKDNIMWRRLRHLALDYEPPADQAGAANMLPAEAGYIIERNYILPNHAESVSLIEANAHLIDDDKLLDELVRYVGHVAIYQALRSSESLSDRNPSQVGEPYPEHLCALIEHKLNTLQEEYQRLLHSDVLDKT